MPTHLSFRLFFVRQAFLAVVRLAFLFYLEQISVRLCQTFARLLFVVQAYFLPLVRRVAYLASRPFCLADFVDFYLDFAGLDFVCLVDFYPAYFGYPCYLAYPACFDFVDFYIFNFADCLVTCAAGIMICYQIYEIIKEKKAKTVND